MAYVDGFACAVPVANRDCYRTHAERAVKCGADECVVFSWIRWPSKQVRDLAWPKVIADMPASGQAQQMPFDGQRMIFGGFDVIVDA